MVGFIQTKKNGWLYVRVFVYLWIMKPFKIAYSFIRFDFLSKPKLN